MSQVEESILFVKNKKVSLKLFVNYRSLNRITIKNLNFLFCFLKCLNNLIESNDI